MKKISPVNGHLVIEPIKYDDFMATAKETYSEIGVVTATPPEWDALMVKNVEAGDKVYFDSWMAAKFPKEGERDAYYWLVKWEDVRAVEYAKQEVSE
jgi:co-chaperonin GroES (HSP10)